MKVAGILCGLALLVPCVAASGAGEDAFKNIRTAKAATALALLPNDAGSATAFCIDASGYFVTNYHVVQELPAGQRLTLVLNSGDQNEKSIGATTVRIDKENDLAVVKAEAGSTFTPLALGGEELIETQAVTALGYPFGAALTLEKSGKPSVSVNVAHISSLRKSKGKLEIIQLDSQLNPGNSGGPVIDDKGAIVGVVSSGVRGAGINFAVPVSKLKSLLDRPEINFTPPAIAEGKFSEAVTLSIRAVPFGKPRPDMTIEVVLTASGGGERTFPAQRGSEKDVYTARVVPVPPRPAGTIPAELAFPDGSIRCWVDDLAFRLDNKPYKLSQISRLEVKGAGAILKNRDGTSITGAAFSIAPLVAHFGGYNLAVDATKAVAITISESDKAAPSVAYRIIAKSSGAIIGEQKGMLLGSSDAIAAGDPAAPATAPGDAGVGNGGGTGWIALLNKIQLKRDTDVGNWTIAGNALRNVEQREVESSRLTIPVKPTGDYIFEFNFVRSKDGKDLCVLFPVGGRGAMIWIGAFDGQQSSLDGPNTKGRGDLVRIMDGKQHHVEITVLNKGATSEIKMKLNGVDFLSWTGDPTKLRVNAGRATRDGRTLGFAVCHHTVVEFTDLRVKALTGAAVPYVQGE